MNSFENIPLFERIFQTDPSRESGYAIEKHVFIELSDKEILDRLSPKIIPIVKNEKSKSKNTKRKATKNDTEFHKAAVESIQEKLQ